MENPNKVMRGQRKENIPPPLSSDAAPEQRLVQKNVNVNLFSDSFKDTAVSRHSSGAAVPPSNCKRAAAHGNSEAVTAGGAKPRRHLLVQTNLSCPYRPFWDTPRGVSGGSSRQQSNLETKLRCRGSENVACVAGPPCLCTVDLGSGCPCLDPVRLKGSPENDVSGGRKCRGRKPREGLGLCGVPCSCSEISRGTIGNKDPQVLKHPNGGLCMSGGGYRTLGTAGDSFCPTSLYGRPSAGSFLHDRGLHPDGPSRSFSSSPPGPALTLDHLRASASAESHAASTTLHVLLRSSQVSADLHSSIQHLKEEASSMGALSSAPWEPKSLPHASRFDPRVSSPGRPSAAEQLAGEESCAKQARVKWQHSFARDWGLGSTTGTWEAPPPFGCGYRKAGQYTHSREASGQFWPPASCGGVGSSSSVCRGGEGCSHPSFGHLGSCPRMQQVLERKSPSGHLKTYYHQKMLDPEELSSWFFHCPEQGCGETPLCHPSFDGLEVSLETLPVRPPVNVGVTVDSTHGEVHVTVRSPEVNQVGNDATYVDLHDLQDEAEGADGVLLTPQVTDESVLFLLAEEIAGKSLGERSSAAADSLGPSGLGGPASVSKNSGNGDCWPEAGHGQGGRFPTGENATSSKFPRCEESRHGMDAVQKETLRRKDEPMDEERSRGPPQSTPLLAEYFTAWRERVSSRKAAAQALYERQLLRKGLGALKWAVELQHVQAGIARRRHNRTVLAACFRRWRGATVKRQEERALCVEMEPPLKGSPAVLRGEKIVMGPFWRQLSAECLEAATQYGRAEGNLWLQIHCNRGVDEPDRRAQAVRDMRRLAAAFRLWRLQKERLDEEESRARDACALLEKKRLRSAFKMWRSHYWATERILPLMAQIRRRLVHRCFNTWKGCAERKARARCCLDRQRVRALQLCFRQWAQMVRVREGARRTLLELLALRQRTAYARFGFALTAPKMQPHPNPVRQFQRNGSDTLDSLYIALVLQEMFYAWKARWRQQQRLDAFRQAVEQKLLREALGRWRWKALRLPPSSDLAGEPLPASLDSDEYSVSSGFHSNTPALPAFSDSLEREASLMDSISSLVTITDDRYLLRHLSPPPTPSPGPEDHGDEAVEFWVQASSPLRNPCGGADGFVKDPFQALGFLGPDGDIHSVTVSPSGEVASPGGGKKDIFEKQRQLLGRCFALWSSWTLQNSKGQRLRRHSLLSWALISWSAATARASTQRKARVWLESVRQQRLLASCFTRWKAELSGARQRREAHRLRRRPTGCKAVWRWRKAVRGYQALRGNTGTVVQQSCNYWTKAASFHLCRRQRSSLVGAAKFVKMPLSWPRRKKSGSFSASRHPVGDEPRRNREDGLLPSIAVRARLNGSAFHVWLVVYRSQSRAVGSSPQGPSDRLGGAEWSVRHAEIQGSSAEVDSTRWLWRKYLRLWRHNVLLRRFREARRIRHLVGAWLLWKDTCQAEWVVQALARQRLELWSWKVWRRRYLQARVAERFLEAQDRSLLKRAFERWRYLAAEVNSRHQGSF